MFISYKKYGHLVQTFCSLSRQSQNFMALSSTSFCIISIFLKGIGVFDSNTVHLIVNLSKMIAIYTKRRTYICFRNFQKLFPDYQNSSKTHNVNKNGCNSKFLRDYQQTFRITCSFQTHEFSMTAVALFFQFPSTHKIS